MKIISLEDSNRKNKRYKITMDDGKEFHFGLKDALTYIDGADLKKRNAFLKRHLNNPLEKELIKNLIPSPALFATYILWNTNDIDKNIKILNNKFADNKKE